MADNKITTRTVQTPGGAITYRLERKAVKNLNLRVRRDGSVCLSAHRRVPAARADTFVLQKWDYILEALRRFAQLEEQRPAPLQYLTGERVTILGRALTLEVIPSPRDQVEEAGGRLLLRTKTPEDASRREKLVEAYLDRRCRELFGRMLEEAHPLFRQYGVPMPSLRVRAMKTRWGSCLPGKGIVTLNRRLLEAPERCIWYVVVHEMCHFIHPDHSPRFYALLESFLPDWRQLRGELNGR